MTMGKEIKKILIEEELTQAQLAEKIGTSQQNINAKIRRDNFNEKEIKEIANALGYELKIEFIKKNWLGLIT